MRKDILSLVLVCLVLPLALSAQTLIEAVRKGDTTLVLKLIKEGADPGKLDSNGNSGLSTACMWGDSTMVSLLLENGASPKKPCSSLGRTPLMVACAYYSGTSVCKLLVNKGADVNAVTGSGKTALMLAAKAGKKDVVDYLLSAGADASKRDIAGFRALDFAENIDVTIVQTLRTLDYNVDSDGVVARLREVTKP